MVLNFKNRTMTISTFSPELCQKLSSFTPKFKKHYGYYKFYDGTVDVACDDEIWWSKKWLRVQQSERKVPEFICPAWQVEDVLRDLHGVLYCIVSPEERFKVVEKITKILFSHPADTAYQKIEEYLWTILK